MSCKDKSLNWNIWKVEKRNRITNAENLNPERHEWDCFVCKWEIDQRLKQKGKEENFEEGK